MKMILYMEMMMMVYDESSLMMMMLNCKIKRQIISILGAANCHVYRGDRQGWQLEYFYKTIGKAT